MNRSDSTLPFRQATRLLNEYQFNVATDSINASGCKHDRVPVFLMILGAASYHRAYLSSSGISNSLGRPLETVRRSMIYFTNMNYIKKTDGRFHIEHNFMEIPAVSKIASKIISQFRQLARDFRATGFSIPDNVENQGYDVTLTAALDVYLSVYELSEARSLDNIIDLYLVGCISVINASAITHNPTLARRYGYADTVPPKDVRKPASAKSISEKCNLSYSTVRRHLQKLCSAGSINEFDGGYILDDRWIDNEQTSALSREKIIYLRRIFAKLAA